MQIGQRSSPTPVKALRTKQVDASRTVRQQGRRGKARRHINWSLLAMAAPGIIVLLVFSYLPMAGVLIAFKNYLPYQGFFGSAWVGFENFRFLFGNSEAATITYNTLFMNTLFIVASTVVCLGIALMLNEIRDTSKFLSKIYQSVIFFPYLVSYVLVSYFVFALLNADNGLLNHVLILLHIKPIDWYASPQYWPLILTLVYLWKSIGFGTIIYIAGMVAISPEYYEAAQLDGANKWQQVRFITLPLLKPLIILTVLLAIGRIFYADFGLFFQVTRNQPLLYPTTDVIDTFVYRALITLDDIGMSSAAGVYQSVVGFVLIFAANWLVRRVDPDQAAF